MQLSFSFPINVDIYDTRNFVVHDGNRDVFDFITSSFLIDYGSYLLTGPKSCGKTYICNIWNRLKGASFIDVNIFASDYRDFINKLDIAINRNCKYILEDIERIYFPDEYLLCLLNLILERKATLLMTSRQSVCDFHFDLEDLNSRFKNIVNFVMKDLNDDSKQQVILKMLSDRQMNIDSNILLYISEKISGSYEEISNFINILEKKIQTEGTKRITMNIVNNILALSSV